MSVKANWGEYKLKIAIKPNISFSFIVLSLKYGVGLVGFFFSVILPI